MFTMSARACARSVSLVVVACAVPFTASRARADEIWVAPTSQQDLGGLGIASNTVWPATPAGAVRLAWAIPDNLETFQSAKLVLIPHGPGGGATVNVFVCAAEREKPVLGDCAGPFAQPFTGAANHLAEVEVYELVKAKIGKPGVNYVAVLAYTTPTTATDHIVGLRFTYTATAPSGVATLAANTFTGPQTAPAFRGNGAELTNLPFPTGAATLGANVFGGTQTAPAFVGSGAGLTNLPVPAGGAQLTGGNAFTGTQSITSGNLNLDISTATTGVIMLAGVPFIHSRSSNAFIGLGAGNLTQFGSDNVGAGSYALSALTRGTNNTAMGSGALLQATEAQYNTALGGAALFSNIVGGGNTAVGLNSLVFTSGSWNTAVGANAGSAATTGSFNIYLGTNTYGVAGESNTMYLGKVGTQTKTLIAGVRGITTVNANAIPVMIDSDGQLGTVSSSIRFKEDVQNMADASRGLFALRPVTFRYSQAYGDGSKPVQYGLVAEEVAAAFPALAVRGADGQVETVHYETLNVLLLNEVQRQQREMEQQQRRIDALERRLNELLDVRVPR